jgi:hypothetical protein
MNVAKLIKCELNHFLSADRVRNISELCNSMTTQCTNFSDNLLGWFMRTTGSVACTTEIIYYDGGAKSSKRKRVFASNASSGAGNQRHSASKRQ